MEPIFHFVSHPQKLLKRIELIPNSLTHWKRYWPIPLSLQRAIGYARSFIVKYVCFILDSFRTRCTSSLCKTVSNVVAISSDAYEGHLGTYQGCQTFQDGATIMKVAQVHPRLAASPAVQPGEEFSLCIVTRLAWRVNFVLFFAWLSFKFRNHWIGTALLLDQDFMGGCRTRMSGRDSQYIGEQWWRR